MNIWDIVKIVFWILIVSGTVFYFTKSVKRLFQVAGGLALFEAYNSLYDYGLWPIIQGWFGSNGVIGLTIGALVLNLIMLKWYQKCRVDWLGITVVDDFVAKIIEVRRRLWNAKLAESIKSVRLACETGSLITRSVLLPIAALLFFAEKLVAVRAVEMTFLSLPTLLFWMIEKMVTIRIIPFLTLSVIQDSFVATAFYLHQTNGTVRVAMKAKDYAVFVFSTLFSCFVYTLVNEWVIIPAFKNVWQTFIH
ncbi:MAG: hypothetical protein WCO10_03400 [bacterium]